MTPPLAILVGLKHTSYKMPFQNVWTKKMQGAQRRKVYLFICIVSKMLMRFMCCSIGEMPKWDHYLRKMTMSFTKRVCFIPCSNWEIDNSEGSAVNNNVVNHSFDRFIMLCLPREAYFSHHPHAVFSQPFTIYWKNSFSPRYPNCKEILHTVKHVNSLL